MSKSVIPKPRPIYLAWLDSIRHDDGWDTVEAYADVAKPSTLLHTTLAYLVAEDEFFVMVSAHISAVGDEQHVCSAMQIPKVAIIDRRWIDLPELPKLAEMMTNEGMEA
jgi:hypothetical protein